ncbi:MAG: hypothetical protein PHS57_01175 [Alphaproteobacteria bacterium]|nr:hypothetical protein [Alphaproteobacteria bacterium]
MSAKEPNDPTIAQLDSIVEAFNSLPPTLLKEIYAVATLKETIELRDHMLHFLAANYGLKLLTLDKKYGHDVSQEALDASQINLLIRVIKIMDKELAIAARIVPLETVAKFLEVPPIDWDGVGRKILRKIEVPNVIALFDAAFELQRKEAENAKNVAGENRIRTNARLALWQKQPTP